MWLELCKWTKDMKILMSRVKVISAEEKSSNQVDRMAPSMDCQPPSPAISVSAPWAMKKVAMVAGMKVVCGLGNMAFHSPGWPGHRSANNRDQHRDPAMPPVTSWRVDCIGPFPPWEGQCSVLTGVDTYPGYGFSFPPLIASA